MKSAPTIALEAMLDLPPLPAMVKKEAAQSAFRMLDSFKPKDFQGVMDQTALSDKSQLGMTLKLHSK
jgi:hypothetical protein